MCGERQREDGGGFVKDLTVWVCRPRTGAGVFEKSSSKRHDGIISRRHWHPFSRQAGGVPVLLDSRPSCAIAHLLLRLLLLLIHPTRSVPMRIGLLLRSCVFLPLARLLDSINMAGLASISPPTEWCETAFRRSTHFSSLSVLDRKRTWHTTPDTLQHCNLGS
jgi:hypothetical protein